MYIRRIESLNPDIYRPFRNLDYLFHLMNLLKIVEDVGIQESKVIRQRVADLTLSQADFTLNLLEKFIYETLPVYLILFPPEVLQKTHYEKVSLNEKLSRLNRTLSSLSERQELSIGGLIDLFG